MDAILKTERRKTIRRKCCLPVTLETIAITGADLWTGQAEDISEFGLGLVMGRRYEPGTLVSVRIGEGNTSPLTLLARVIRAVLMPNGAWLLGFRLPLGVDADELGVLLEEADRPAAGRQAEQETRVLATTVKKLDLKAIREKLQLLARCAAAT